MGYQKAKKDTVRRSTMAPRTAITCILLALILPSAACAPAPATIPPIAAPEPGTWRIIPIGLEVEAASDGKQTVTVDVAFENGTDEHTVKEFKTDGSYITVEGGDTFPVTVFSTSEDWGWTAQRTAIGVDFALPPTFGARGIRVVTIGYDGIAELGDIYWQLLADVPDNAHPTKLTIPDYGELNLDVQLRSPTFPGEARGVPVYEVGEGAEVPDKAVLTITRVTREAMELPGEAGHFDRVTVYISYKNLMDSYDDTFSVHLSLIGDDGFFHQVVFHEEEQLPYRRLRADAGETMTFEKWYVVAPETKGLMMIATGGVNALFDIDTGL